MNMRPWSAFGAKPRPGLLQHGSGTKVFGAIRDFPGRRKWPHKPKQYFKKSSKIQKLSSRNHAGADLGAIWRRKRSKDACSSIWCRFFVDLGWFLDNFRLIVDVVFEDFETILT
jgi:hypothetical protein